MQLSGTKVGRSTLDEAPGLGRRWSAAPKKKELRALQRRLDRKRNLKIDLSLIAQEEADADRNQMLAFAAEQHAAQQEKVVFEKVWKFAPYVLGGVGVLTLGVIYWRVKK